MSALFEAEVTHLSQQGYGVVKGPGRAIFFVRGAFRGDRGIFRATDESEERYRFAVIEELLHPSPDRQDVACPHFGIGPDQCYGCPWMTIDYAAQLREKQHRVQYALERVGINGAPVREIWPSPAITGYRRRAQFKTDGQRIGYAGQQGRCIAPIDRCLILTPSMQDRLTALRSQLPQAEWQPTPPHIRNYLDIDEDTDPETVALNRRRPFQQANAAQNEAMRQWLRVELQPHPISAPVLELFAGSGNFTDVVVQLGFASIRALEVGAEAVSHLQNKGWRGVTAERIDLYARSAAAEVSRAAADTEILIANPPRAGLGDHWRLAYHLPLLRSIYIISCDPGSFATDIRRLLQHGFSLHTVQPLDQMPHTPHVEILARLEKHR